MKIAIASGKGGTGKTMLSLALASVFAYRGETSVDLLDCDVEAPNAHLFSFWPSAGHDLRDGNSQVFGVPRPMIDPQRCTACGACVEFCAFGALARVGEEILTFPELCHSCGGCTLVCPEGAVSEESFGIGTISTGVSVSGERSVNLTYGTLNIGETLVPPLIREVRRRGRPEAVQIIDCPPGSTCPMVTAVTSVDFVLLVTENTPFGIHDLEAAADVVRKTGTPFGVVINRSDVGSNATESAAAACRRFGFPVLLSLPFDERIAETYAAGRTLLDAGPFYRGAVDKLAADILAQIGIGG